MKSYEDLEKENERLTKELETRKTKKAPLGVTQEEFDAAFESPDSDRAIQIIQSTIYWNPKKEQYTTNSYKMKAFGVTGDYTVDMEFKGTAVPESGPDCFRLFLETGELYYPEALLAPIELTLSEAIKAINDGKLTKNLKSLLTESGRINHYHPLYKDLKKHYESRIPAKRVADFNFGHLLGKDYPVTLEEVKEAYSASRRTKLQEQIILCTSNSYKSELRTNRSRMMIMCGAHIDLATSRIPRHDEEVTGDSVKVFKMFDGSKLLKPLSKKK